MSVRPLLGSQPPMEGFSYRPSQGFLTFVLLFDFPPLNGEVKRAPQSTEIYPPDLLQLQTVIMIVYITVTPLG